MKKYSKEWLSKEEIKKMFECPDINSRNLLLIRLTYFGALRISEALNSKLEDFKHEDDYYFLILRKQKTDKKNWEKQPIPPQIYGEVVRFCKDNKIMSQDYVFKTQKSSKMTYNRAYMIVKEISNKLNLNKEITTHSLRRSRATHLLDGDVDLYKVSGFLRHKRIETTQKYLKLSKKVLYSKMVEADAISDLL